MQATAKKNGHSKRRGSDELGPRVPEAGGRIDRGVSMEIEVAEGAFFLKLIPGALRVMDQNGWNVRVLQCKPYGALRPTYSRQLNPLAPFFACSKFIYYTC